MRPRIAVAELHLGDTILDESSSHHLARVLRCRAGEIIILFDGCGAEAEAHILDAQPRGVHVRVEHITQTDRESPLAITVVQSLCTGDKMDWVIQKSTELGASCIVPLAASRSVLRLDGQRAQRRIEHWQAVAKAASSQSGRSRTPLVTDIQALGPLLDNWKRAALPRTGWLLDPFATDTLSQSPMARDVTILIGPEAGWTDNEEALARDAGFLGIRCGPRILRTETAACAILAALAMRCGEF
jgi:16S rRNA (uracil1498-N3)-methyltransferase